MRRLRWTRFTPRSEGTTHTRRTVLAGGALGLGAGVLSPAAAQAQLPIDDRYVLRERAPFNVKDYGATGDGTTNDAPAIQDAIDDAAAVGGSVVFPPTSASYKVASTLSIPTQGAVANALGLTLKGYGGFVILNYTGSGTLFSLPGTSGSATVPYVTFEDLRLTGPNAATGSIPTGTTKGISASYANVVTLNRVFVKGFGTGVELGSSCTGWKLHQVQIARCVTGLAITGAGSGGFDWYGGQVDTNVLGVSIDASLNGVSLCGLEFDTDSDGDMGSSGVGAAVVKGGAARVSFNDCRFFAEATPTQGATVLLDGGCVDILFSNCHFTGNAGGSSSQAAVKLASTSFVKVIGGRTTGHTTSSYVVTSSAASVLMLDTNNAEGTRITGTGSAYPVVVATENGSLVAKGALIADGNSVVVRKGNALQLNKSDDTANVTLQYSSGEIYTGNPLRLDNYMKLASIAAASVPSGSLFRDSADGKLKFKDAGGTVNPLY